MMRATIQLNFPIETSFEEALVEAIRLATKLEVFCEFVIDEIRCIACEDSSEQSAIDQYNEMKKNHSVSYIFA